MLKINSVPGLASTICGTALLFLRPKPPNVAASRVALPAGPGVKDSPRAKTLLIVSDLSTKTQIYKAVL